MAKPKGETPEAEVQDTEAQVEETEVIEDPKVEKFDEDSAKELIKKLRGIEKQAKKDKSALDKLENAEADRLKAEMSETDRLKAEVAERDVTIKELTTKSQQREIADKVLLPAIFADRIKGETPEEMEADARLLLEAIPKGKIAANAGATNPGEAAVTGETEEQTLKRLGLR